MTIWLIFSTEQILDNKYTNLFRFNLDFQRDKFSICITYHRRKSYFSFIKSKIAYKYLFEKKLLTFNILSDH